MWIRYQPNPTGAKAGDCAVRAVAKALNISWEQAYIMIAVNGFQMGDVMSADNVWGSVLRQKGFKRKSIPNQCPECYDIVDFCNDNPKGIFVLGTGNHAVAVVDGNYYDAWDSGNEVPTYYWFI